MKYCEVFKDKLNCNNADEVFEKIGVLTPRVYEKAELKRISTILYTPKQRKELENCFACLDVNIL